MIRDLNEWIRYRKFDIENPPHEGTCAQKNPALKVLNIFGRRFEKFVLMIAPKPFIDKKIFPIQVQDSDLYFHHLSTDFSSDNLFERNRR